MRYPQLMLHFLNLIFLCGLLMQTVLQGASAVTKKTRRASESMSSVSAGGLDGLPREDISGKISPTLLKSLESPDWKVCLKHISNQFALCYSCNRP